MSKKKDYDVMKNAQRLAKKYMISILCFDLTLLLYILHGLKFTNDVAISLVGTIIVYMAQVRRNKK